MERPLLTQNLPDLQIISASLFFFHQPDGFHTARCYAERGIAMAYVYVRPYDGTTVCL